MKFIDQSCKPLKLQKTDESFTKYEPAEFTI